jgi:hypothetical protein
VFLRRFLDGMPGYLFFLGYYELLAFFKVPFYFTVDRVTNIYRYQSALLGFFEFDLLLYLILCLLLLSMFPKERSLVLLMGMSGSGVILLRFLNFDLYSFPLLGVIFIVTGFWCYKIRRDWDVLWGFLTPLIIVEAASILSSISFYLFGEWFPFFYNIILKERLIWAPLEWIVVPFFFLTSLFSWYKFFIVGSSNDNSNMEFEGNILLYSVFLIVILVSLPHLPTVNPHFKAVSVDTEDYGVLFERADKNGLISAVQKQHGKPLYFLVLFCAWILLNRNTVLLMDLLHPIFVLSGLALVSSHITRKRGGGSYSSLLVPLGYTLTGFLGGGFQADSLALIPCILAIYADRKDPRVWYKVILLMTLTGLIHSWTYLMYATALLAFELLEKKNISKPIISIAVSFGIINLVDYLFDLSLEVMKGTTEPVIKEVGFYLFGNWFKSLNFWVWNSLSNPVYVMGSLFSLDSASSSLLAVSAPLMLVLPANLVFRLILNIPLHIPGSKRLSGLSPIFRKIVILFLFVRVLGNLTGLTPYIPVT